MDANTYLLLHLVGLAMVFLGLGGMFAHGGEGKPPRLYVVLHAVGLLVMLVAGFGRAQKMNFPLTSGWILGKAVLWLFLGALPVLVRKGLLPRALGWIVALAVVAAAAYLALWKPWSS